MPDLPRPQRTGGPKPLCPRHERPLVETLAARGAPARTVRLHADHGFVPARLPLASHLLDWLEELPEPR